MRTLPRDIALAKGGLNTDDTINARENIGECHANFLRLTIGCAGQIHDPAHRLDHEIIARPLRIRTVLAKACHRAINETRINRF